MTPPNEQIVLSASRRTDIPAFYMDWFIKQINSGFFKVKNPYKMREKIVPARAKDVHTIVFWSKDFGYFLEKKFGERLEKKGYNLFFNFTVNSESDFLEQNIPSLKTRLTLLEELAQRFDPDLITWRFDPVCFYRQKGTLKNNLADFEFIADKASSLKISRCITSFMDMYPKIIKRTAKIPDFKFVKITDDYKRKILLKMEKLLLPKKIRLFTCCEKKVMEGIPKSSSIKGSSCIPSVFLKEKFGSGISLEKDFGQRIKQGCGCKISVDIGSYKMQPCFHRCLFCYANPSKF